MAGQIVDATVIEARRPYLTAAEKATLREGGTPAGWSKVRPRQIDRDAAGRLSAARRRRRPAGRAGPARRYRHTDVLLRQTH